MIFKRLYTHRLLPIQVCVFAIQRLMVIVIFTRNSLEQTEIQKFTQKYSFKEYPYFRNSILILSLFFYSANILYALYNMRRSPSPGYCTFYQGIRRSRSLFRVKEPICSIKTSRQCQKQLLVQIVYRWMFHFRVIISNHNISLRLRLRRTNRPELRL